MSTRSTLITEFADNTANAITAAYCRDFIDSAVLPEDLAGTGSLASSITTISGQNIVLNSTTTPSSPVAGQIYFDGTHFQGFDGSSWLQLD